MEVETPVDQEASAGPPPSHVVVVQDLTGNVDRQEPIASTSQLPNDSNGAGMHNV